MEFTKKFLKARVFSRPIDDDLFFSLNIWEKFYHYRRVPVKLLVNVIVCILLTNYALSHQLFINDYAVKARYGVALSMIDPEDETDSAFDKQIANIGDFEDFLVGFVGGYYELPMSSLGVFMHFAYGLDDPTPLPVTMDVRYATTKDYTHVETQSFELTMDDPLGPFENVTNIFPQTETCMPHDDGEGNNIVPCRNDTLADFFDVLQSVTLKATLRGTQSNPSSSFASVLKWTVETNFEFSAHNSVLRAKTTINFSETQRLVTGPVVMSLAVIFFTLWGLVLRLYFFLRHFDYANKALSPALLRRYRETVAWHYFGILAGVMSIIFCIVTLSSAFLNFVDYNLVQWRSVVLGFALFFEYVLLLSHFQNVPRMYVIAQSITKALPHLCYYFISVFPVFFGFSLASSAALGGVSEIFDSLPHSMITLFCMICGDSLIDIFTMSNTTNFAWLQAFCSIILASYVFTFIANVLNMMLALVQDSYSWVRETHDVEERIHKRIQRSQRRTANIFGNADTLAEAIATLKGSDFHKIRNANGGYTLFSNTDENDNRPGTYVPRPAVDPFDDEELAQLRQRFTVRRTEVDSSCSEFSDNDRDDGVEDIHHHEEKHFHKKRFHKGDREGEDEGAAAVIGGFINSIGSRISEASSSPRNSTLDVVGDDTNTRGTGGGGSTRVSGPNVTIRQP